MEKIINKIVEQILIKINFNNNSTLYFDINLEDNNENILNKGIILLNLKKSNNLKVNCFFNKEDINYYLEKYSVKLNVDIEISDKHLKNNNNLKKQLKENILKNLNDVLIYINKFKNHSKSNLFIIKKSINKIFPKDIIKIIDFFENINSISKNEFYLIEKEIYKILEIIDLNKINNKKELEKELNLFPYISNLKRLSSYRIKEEMLKMNIVELEKTINEFNKDKFNFKKFDKYKIKDDVSKFCWYWGEEIIKKGNSINSKISKIINENWDKIIETTTQKK